MASKAFLDAHEARALDLTGCKFGSLTAIRRTAEKRHRTYVWETRCDCGVTKMVPAKFLRGGNVTSCGCSYRRRAPHIKHGHSRDGARSPSYKTWCAIISRCHNPRATGYDEYGGRGVSVCARWREDFRSFLADMGERPPRMTIDRIDSHGDYEPFNCQWTTPWHQTANRSVASEDMRRRLMADMSRACGF